MWPFGGNSKKKEPPDKQVVLVKYYPLSNI